MKPSRSSSLLTTATTVFITSSIELWTSESDSDSESDSVSFETTFKLKSASSSSK